MVPFIKRDVKISYSLAGFTSAIQSIPAGTWKILITDDHSQTLLDTVYTNYDILQQNVTCEWAPISRLALHCICA